VKGHPSTPHGPLVLACLLGGSAGWAMTAAGAGAASLGPSYDVGLVAIGLMTTALAIPYAALQMPAGSFVDRVGVRTAAVLGLSLVVLANLMASTTPLLWLALLCRSLAGVGYAVCFVSGAELARSSGSGPSGMGVFGGVALAASGFAVLMVPLAEPSLGWRAAWLTSAVIALVALLVVARLPPATPAARRAGPTAGRPPTRGPSLLRDGELHRLAAVHAVTLGLGVVLSNWAVMVLEESWGFSRTTAALTGSVVLGMSVLSRPLGGYLARRSPERVGLMVVLSLLGCSAATVALVVPSAPGVAVAAVLTLGVLSGLPFAGVIIAGQARRPDRPAAAVGLLNGQANGVIVVGTPLMGAALEHGRTSTALVLVAALWLAPLLARPRSTRRGSASGSRTAPSPALEPR
jgi:predicted MFS family arabinose efflux permease